MVNGEFFGDDCLGELPVTIEPSRWKVPHRLVEPIIAIL